MLQSGQTLQNGKYTVERDIGRRRFTISYLATRRDGDRWVIKVLDPALLATLTEVERNRLETQFMQEAVKLARCSSSPYIASVGDPFKEGDLICLPVEYMGQESLALRSQRVLTEEAALSYIRQLGEALTVVHQQGLVHRDICPANIFLRIRDGKAEAVLTEFGLAMDCDTELSRTRKHELNDGFSPIELYGRGRKVGPFTDVYGLAATLYAMLTGKIPASAEDRQVNQVKLVSPQSFNPDLSGSTTKAIMRGLELSPEKRPQSMSDWLRLFDKPPDLPPKPPKPVDWAKWGVIVAIITAAITLLGIIPAWRSSNPTPSPSGQTTAKPTP